MFVVRLKDEEPFPLYVWQFFSNFVCRPEGIVYTAASKKFGKEKSRRCGMYVNEHLVG